MFRSRLCAVNKRESETCIARPNLSFVTPVSFVVQHRLQTFPTGPCFPHSRSNAGNRGCQCIQVCAQHRTPRHTLNTAVFMDYSVCSSAIGNIQDLMRNSNVQCHLATTYTCLCTEVLRQSSNWDKILVIGIHAGFRFSKDEQVDEYLCFLEECKQLADENMVQAEFVNLQHLDWTCCVPDATFHCTQDSNSLWVYHTSWEQQLMKARQLYRKPPQSAAHQPTKPPIN